MSDVDNSKMLALLRGLPTQPPAIDISEYSKPSHVAGRVVVITGGNAGLGYAAAEHFAKLKPARLIISSRNQEKGDKAAEKLRHSTGFDAVEVRPLDASDFTSAKAFADGIVKEVGRVDILILNAGIHNMEDTTFVTAGNGNELLLQTNNLGQELLTFLLLPTILKTEKENPTGSKPRIVVVSSAAANYTTLDEDLINHPHILKRMSEADYCKPEVMNRRYPDTKLFNIWFANALQDRLTAARSNIVVNSLNPGFVLTNFLEKIPDVNMQNAMRGLANEKAYTAEEGGRFLLQAALEYADDSEKEKAFMGVFFDYGKVTEVSEFGRGEVGKKIQEKLWLETVDELNKVDNRVRGIVESLST